MKKLQIYLHVQLQYVIPNLIICKIDGEKNGHNCIEKSSILHLLMLLTLKDLH